jgi:hypothetical protein
VIRDGVPGVPAIVAGNPGLSSPATAPVAGGAVALAYEDESETFCRNYIPDIRFDVLTP